MTPKVLVGRAADALKDRVFQHYDLLERLARKRFPDENLADQALVFVLDGLEANGWQRVQSFQERSSFRTFLGQVVSRLLTDFYRKEFGYVRPPKWIKQLGGFWRELYKLLCLERKSPLDAMETMKSNLGDGVGEEKLTEAIEVILEKVTDCGKKKFEMVPKEPELLEAQAPTDPSLHEFTPEKLCSAHQTASLMEAVFYCLTTSEEDFELSLDQGKLRTKLLDLRLRLKLTHEEQIFLRLCAHEGYSVTRAGRALGWKTDQASGRFRRLKERIGKAINESGLEEWLDGLLN